MHNIRDAYGTSGQFDSDTYGHGSCKYSGLPKLFLTPLLLPSVSHTSSRGYQDVSLAAPCGSSAGHLRTQGLYSLPWPNMVDLYFSNLE